MNRDLVISTSYQRPELLALSLEHLLRCPEFSECDFAPWVDDHVGSPPSDGIFEVLSRLDIPEERIWQGAVRVMEPHKTEGMNAMIMECLKEAYLSNYRYVFLLEEDILPTPDWIRWSRAAHEQYPEIFCSYGTLGTEHPDCPWELVAFESFFSAWGASWKRENLRPIVEHAVSEYYSDMWGYQMQRWPEQLGKHQVAAWDGLVCHIMQAKGLKAAYPLMPRACHIGIWGFYRNRVCPLVSPTLDERIEEMRQHLQDPTFMTRQYADCLPCNMNSPQWSSLISQ